MSSEQLLVFMRVRNAESLVQAALSGIVAQEGVHFRVVVVDDASSDGTAAAVESVRDSRIQLVRSSSPVGTTGCRELALALSGAPFVADVPPRGVILRDGLRKLLDACVASPTIGLAHSYYFDADEKGHVSRDAYRDRREHFEAVFGPDGDFRRELLLGSIAVGPLRVFRREALESARGWTPRSDSAGDLVTIVRVVNHFEIATVREHLFCQRTERKPARRWGGLRNLADATTQALTCRKALAGVDGLFREGGYRVERDLMVRVYRASGLARAVAAVGRMKRRSRRLYRRTQSRLTDSLYYALVERLAPAATRFLPAPAPVTGESPRIAYYTWHFPVLSQTFVNRELAALTRSGVAIDVIADEAEDLALADHNAERVLEHASYLLPVDAVALARHRRFFWRRRPITYLRTLLFVLASRQIRQKQLGIDRQLFAKAVYLAGVLRERGITHIHAPWADNCAFVALVAARLAGIQYSVQARAHEIHRRAHAHGLRDRLESAAFIVTNTEYNAHHLRTLLGEDRGRHVHVINNGVDLERFEPAARLGSGSTRAHILCVARLIEQKGLVHLLQACRTLLDRGVDLTCTIIGGSEEPLYTNYLLDLRRTYRRLDLEGRVHFCGARPLSDVLKAYREADLFVLPSVIAEDGARDITPNALIEAMAMGLPVVSTQVGGIPEIVEDGVSGLLVPPGDAAALADAMALLIRDRRRAATLGTAARSRVEAKFDIGENVHGYIQLFSRCAATSAAGALATHRTLTPESVDR